MSTGPIRDTAPDLVWQRLEAKIDDQADKIGELHRAFLGDLAAPGGALGRLASAEERISRLETWRTWIVATATAIATTIAGAGIWQHFTRH